MNANDARSPCPSPVAHHQVWIQNDRMADWVDLGWAAAQDMLPLEAPTVSIRPCPHHDRPFSAFDDPWSPAAFDWDRVEMIGIRIVIDGDDTSYVGQGAEEAQQCLEDALRQIRRER